MNFSISFARSLRILAAGAALCGAGLAQAATVSIFNTGVNANGSLQSLGSVDTHWRIVSGPGLGGSTNAYVLNNQSVGGVYYQSSNSRWISLNANGQGMSSSQVYTFELSFDLTGYDASTAVLSGSWGVDNEGTIKLNDASAVGTGTFWLPGVNSQHFQVAHAFTITDGFTSGENKLQFQLVDYGGLSGLNVSSLSLTADAAAPAAVPEPGSLPLLAAGGLGLVLSRRRATRRG